MFTLHHVFDRNLNSIRNLSCLSFRRLLLIRTVSMQRRKYFSRYFLFSFFFLVFFLCITRETILSNFDLFEQVEESLQLLFHRCCNNYSRLFKENVSNRRRRGTLGRKFSSSVEYILNIIETKIVFFHYSSIRLQQFIFITKSFRTLWIFKKWIYTTIEKQVNK